MALKRTIPNISKLWCELVEERDLDGSRCDPPIQMSDMEPQLKVGVMSESRLVSVRHSRLSHEKDSQLIGQDTHQLLPVILVLLVGSVIKKSHVFDPFQKKKERKPCRRKCVSHVRST